MKKFKAFKKNKEKRKFKSSVSLFLSGYNLERYLNQLSQKNFKFYDVKKINLKESVVEIPVCDEKNVEKLFKSKNIIVLQKKYNGLAKLNCFFKARFGIFVGIFLCFIFYIISSSLIWKVEVYGNERIETKEIKNVLEQNGIGVFSPLNIKSNSDIEKIILSNFDEVSMVSVVKKGTTVIVSVKEKVINEEYENLDVGSSVVATSDGIITEIKLISGTPLVKVGDSVKVGDVLVAPYIIDSSGTKIPTIAKANIQATVWVSGQSVFESEKEVKQRTGNFFVQRKMVFLDKEILTTQTEVPYLEYEIEEKEELLSDYLLPINYVTTTYYELETVFVKSSFDEEKENLIDQAKKVALARILETDEIVEENVVVTEQDKKILIDFVYTVKRNISS